MAKFGLRIQARSLREKGESVKSIAKQLSVSKSTASIWTRDIILSVEQLEALKQKILVGGEKGRVISALKQKQKWKDELQISQNEGEKSFTDLTERELLIGGVMLYWAEGSKKSRTVEFCNSDPKMIQFILFWLYRCFSVDPKDIACWLSINESHAYREQIVKQYWADVSGLQISQFTGTSFKRILNKKVYDNPEKHFGTFYLRVRQPSRYFKRIIGLIEGIYRRTQKEYIKNNLLAG